ncbi:hypothetical protein GTX14_04845 [Streptomyces sp. SID4944]|nr:hypothetical protein [Streptomyces sp. SID4944]
MSSTYRVLCLSHDPAIIIDGDWRRAEGAEEAVAAGVDGHPHCDLIIGRYSYPLVEVGCPPSRDHRAKVTCYHNSTAWTESEWLRLLAAAYHSSDEAVRTLAAKTSRCWAGERLHRLRAELDSDNA